MMYSQGVCFVSVEVIVVLREPAANPTHANEGKRIECHILI
jgi:hypothetical protein